MKNVVESYCDDDVFCKVFIPQWQKQLLEDGTNKRQRRDYLIKTFWVITLYKNKYQKWAFLPDVVIFEPIQRRERYTYKACIFGLMKNTF